MAATAPAQIRLFQPGDRSQVLALASRLTEGVAPWRDPAAVRRAAQDWVTASIDTAGQPGHAVYVAIAMDRVVGVVTIREQTHFTGQTDAYVGELAVASGMERRGIATVLMNAAEAWAAQRGLAFLTLQTGAANKPARGLYRRLGYHEEELLLTKAISGHQRHGQPHPAQELTTTKTYDELQARCQSPPKGQAGRAQAPASADGWGLAADPARARAAADLVDEYVLSRGISLRVAPGRRESSRLKRRPPV